MRTFYPLQDSTETLQETAVAIGVFDGVHRGHQEILKQTVREAQSQGLTPVVLTFDIHPTELFAPAQSPPYICSLERRCDLIEQFGGGIEEVRVVRFDRAFAALSPEVFVSDILEARLGARHVLVGADFRYGKGRSGTVTILLGAGARNGFAVTVLPPILIGGERVSSTQIRSLVAAGDLPAARHLLGHPFVVQGTVERGKQLGRTLGYPTANLVPIQPRLLLPGSGIYAAYARLADGQTIRAAVSVGTNPTMDSDGARKVEAYLMDGFEADLYDAPLELDFREKVRDEQKFDSLNALVTQIRQDVEQIATRLPLPERRV
ncbi:MAG: bifunctional riboflavin kinase/FAD synthetase [Armatimonadota bacterium]|nr:bifunctional riboflavin kinase/FAD synthetase [Armatimonadota bacterium]